MSDMRVEERSRCRIRARIRARGRTYDGSVLDLSSRGLRVSTDQVADIWTGDEVEVEVQGFGSVAGIARWRTPNRIGIILRDMLYDSTNTSARALALRNFLAQFERL